MPNWSDPAEIVRDAGIFQKFCLALLGVSTWEVFAQLPFDYSMVTGQRKARWPLIIYLYCKYSLWFAVIGVNVALNVTSKVDCQSLYVFNQFAGNTAIGSASTLLMLRTIAIWSHKHAITIPLVVLSLGQWAILFHGVATVKSSWSEVSHACVVTGTKPAFIDLIYLYTMSFDFVVMVASVVGLLYTGGRSSLWILLFKQGVVYFVVAFTANLIPAVFLLLDLNPIMNIMFTIPAATATSIVACRSFVSLTDYKSTEVYVHTARPFSAAASRVVIKGGSGLARPAKNPLRRGMDITIDDFTTDRTGLPVAINMDDYTSRDVTRAPRTTAAASSSTVDVEKGGGSVKTSPRHEPDANDTDGYDGSMGKSFPPVI